MVKTYTTKHKPCGVNKRYGIVNGRNILSKEYRESKKILQTEFMAQNNGRPISGKVSVYIWSGFDKFDIDAHIKIILDALEGIAYINDKQIALLQIMRTKNKELKVEIHG